MGQQRLVVLHAHLAQRRGRQQLLPGRRTARRAHHAAERIAEQLLVQADGGRVVAGQEQVQRVERELVGGERGGHFEHQADAGARVAILVDAERGEIAGGRHVVRLGQHQRPQGQRVRGAVLAGGLLTGRHLAAQHRVARQFETGGEIRVGEFGLELHHRHRRHRREVVRVDGVQQVLGEARVLAVELELHARGEKGEAFQQPLDVRVRALEALEAEPGGDLRELGRELRARLANELQLAVVVLEQARVHGVSPARSRRTRRSRDPRRC